MDPAHASRIRAFFEANPDFNEEVVAATTAFLEHNKNPRSHDGLTAYFIPIITLARTADLPKKIPEHISTSVNKLHRLTKKRKEENTVLLPARRHCAEAANEKIREVAVYERGLNLDEGRTEE
jgi:hypothetical protein